MSTRFVPPFPKPHASKSSLLLRFLRGWNSWIHVLFDKSYTMQMGEIHTPTQSFYIANELSLVERTMVEEWRDFPKHRFLVEMLDPLIGNSVFSANGDDWQQQREMVNPAFSHTALEAVFPLMQAAATALAARIEALPRDQPVGIDPLMTHVAGDIIYRTLFSEELAAEPAAIIYRAFHRYQRHAQSTSTLRIYGLPAFGFRHAAAKAARHIHQVFEPIVRARYQAYQSGSSGGHADILQTLLEARHPATGAPFSYRQIVQQVSTIFLAGHETSASAMTWALYILARCPDLQQAVRDECRAAGMDGTPDAAALKSLPRTRNVFRETLRLYPPVSFFLREVIHPTAMRDKHLAPGAMLVVSPWLIQRNRAHWPDPHAFDPTRFERAEAGAACRHAYLPFGKGPRACVGAGFAMQEALIVIAALVTRLQLTPLPGETPEPVSRLTLRPRRVIRLQMAQL